MVRSIKEVTRPRVITRSVSRIQPNTNNEDPTNTVITIEQEKEEEEDETCNICMDSDVESPLIYTCCKKLVCKACYTTMHGKNKRKDCPYCRHRPTRALPRVPIGIQKRKDGKPIDSEFLISRQAMIRLIMAILRQEHPEFRIQESALYAIRKSSENEIIEIMMRSQHAVTIAGERTVRNLV